jgi:endonuclease YncB( thermonuclease family)
VSDHIGKSLVTYDPRDANRYSRVVAVCRKEAEGLKACMVRRGHAIEYCCYAAAYVNVELTA